MKQLWNTFQMVNQAEIKMPEKVFKISKKVELQFGRFWVFFFTQNFSLFPFFSLSSLFYLLNSTLTETNLMSSPTTTLTKPVAKQTFKLFVNTFLPAQV